MRPPREVTRPRRRVRAAALTSGLLAAALLTACATDTEQPGTGASTQPRTPASADPAPSVEAPGELELPLYPADLLVTAADTLGDDVVARIRKLPGVQASTPLSISQTGVQDRVLTVAAVDAGQYRRFTGAASAQLQAAWDRVAGGEVAIAPGPGRRLQDEQGYVRLGNDQDSPRVHVGALVPQVPRVDAVVNARWGERLGMPQGNALLVTTGRTAPARVRTQIEKIVGKQTSVQVLGPDLDVSAVQTAVLSGGSVSRAVGSFSYRVLGGGRVAPEESWVRQHIVTDAVPILGDVTCHRVLIPQLRAALLEIQQVGLADKIHPGEYAGCYYPRFIANTTQLSLHSFGIALDVNVPGNQRGTVGEIDRRVVAIFKKWGFAWGGDWSWTDPMHFELARLVHVG